MVNVQTTPPSSATVTSSTPATSTATPGLTAIQVTIADITQALQNLTRAIQTGATPVAPPNGNSLTLATALGNITITLPQLNAAEQQTLLQQLTTFALTQRPLTLALQPGSPPTQAVLLIPANNPAPAPILQSSSALPTQVLPVLSLTAGETLPAIVLPPLASSSPATVQTASSPVTPLPANMQPQSSPAPPITASTLPPAPNNVSPLANLLQPGNEVELRVDSVLPSTQTTVPSLASNQILATVSGAGTDGQLILKAGNATLFVKAQISAPIGANIVVTVEAAKAPPLLTLPAFDPVNFPALPQALAALAQIDPQSMAQMMTRIPQPTENLPAALLFLFSAFKQGNTRGWLGDEVTNTLTQAGKLSLIASLSSELGEAGQPAQDGTVGEWRSYPIPLFAQQQFQALTLYVHNDQKGHQERADGKSANTNKVRFLIDMRLSKLGAMQIDGFVQPKKLDMILRSETLLPDGLHNDLRLSYIKALGAVGYTGALNFQVGRQHWMRMQKPEMQGVVT